MFKNILIKNQCIILNLKLMKKLELKSLGKSLSREEMKKVNGALKPSPFCQTCYDQMWDWYCGMVYHGC